MNIKIIGVLSCVFVSSVVCADIQRSCFSPGSTLAPPSEFEQVIKQVLINLQGPLSEAATTIDNLDDVVSATLIPVVCDVLNTLTALEVDVMQTFSGIELGSALDLVEMSLTTTVLTKLCSLLDTITALETDISLLAPDDLVATTSDLAYLVSGTVIPKLCTIELAFSDTGMFIPIAQSDFIITGSQLFLSDVGVNSYLLVEDVQGEISISAFNPNPANEAFRRHQIIDLNQHTLLGGISAAGSGPLPGDPGGMVTIRNGVVISDDEGGSGSVIQGVNLDYLSLLDLVIIAEPTKGIEISVTSNSLLENVQIQSFDQQALNIFDAGNVVMNTVVATLAHTGTVIALDGVLGVQFENVCVRMQESGSVGFAFTDVCGGRLESSSVLDTATGSASTGFLLMNTQEMVCHNCSALCTGTGFLLDAVENICLTECVAKDNDVGYLVRNNAADTVLKECIALGNNDAGFHVVSGMATLVANNAVGNGGSPASGGGDTNYLASGVPTTPGAAPFFQSLPPGTFYWSNVTS